MEKQSAQAEVKGQSGCQTFTAMHSHQTGTCRVLRLLASVTKEVRSCSPEGPQLPNQAVGLTKSATARLSKKQIF